jgi:adenosine deaminase
MNVLKLVRFVSLPIFVLSFVALSSRAQQNDATTERVAQYFERIRFDEARSTQFFEAMPKGGDLHHHFSGAVYAEEMFEAARKQNFFVSRDSLFVYREMPASFITRDTSIYRLSDIRVPANIRSMLLNFWSVKDFVPGAESNEDHFFQSFGRFGPTIGGSEALFLQTIKKRAITENVQYIETMFLRPYFNRSSAPFPDLQSTYDPLLERAGHSLDSIAAHEYFLRMYNTLVSDPQFMSNARSHHENVVELTNQSMLPRGEDSLVTVRYQNYVVRTVSPSDVFAQLLLSMASCDDSLILGVNIVAPEDNEIAMRDYWLHMQMFAFFHTKFPNVPDDLHAGELTLGVVKPEDLTWHIGSAVYIAGAKRIGHGVDMAYERGSDKLLDYMHAHNIAIEINLASNEFILGIKGERHPFTLYEEHHVPIVLGTDDPGVLRTNLTHQFVLLASRYKEVTYIEIKDFVYNSINYSFLPARDKQKLIQKLDNRFHVFESSIANKTGQ